MNRFGLGLLSLIVLVLTACNQQPPQVVVRTASYPPPATPVVASQKLSITNLPATYAAGSELHTGLSGKNNICVINGATVAIAGALGSTAANCSGATDSIVIPSGGNACFENLAINSKVCYRSLDGAVNSAVWLYSMVW